MRSEYAKPSRRLWNLWLEWIQLHKILASGMKGELAAPFFSAANPRCKEGCIMVIGKATAGDYWLGDYKKSKSQEGAVEQRLKLNREVVAGGGNRSAFWTFFKGVEKLRPNPGLDGIIWSNVAKIGHVNRNSSGLLLSAQADLAERTLRAEIEEYHPSLTFFVAGSDPCMSRIILHALNLGPGEADWFRSEKVEPKAKFPDVWWSKIGPAVLWTQHPERKSKEAVTYWLEKAKDLIGSAS